MSSSKAQLNKSTAPIKWIRVRELDVLWREAQRPLSKKKVKDIMDNFDPYAVGVIAVSPANRKGMYHIIDGQHRVEAMRQLWGDNEFVPCQVIEHASTLSEAASTWMTMNTARSKPTAYDRFNVAVQAGQEPDLSVAAIIQRCGYQVGYGKLMSVNACKDIYKASGEPGLRWVLNTITNMWGSDDSNAAAAVVMALGSLYAQYGDVIDTDRLVKSVSRDYTPARLLGAGKAAREMMRGTLHENVRRVMVNSYNANFRHNSAGKLT